MILPLTSTLSLILFYNKTRHVFLPSAGLHSTYSTYTYTALLYQLFFGRNKSCRFGHVSCKIAPSHDSPIWVFSEIHELFCGDDFSAQDRTVAESAPGG